jgi:hypothetical protein
VFDWVAQPDGLFHRLRAFSEPTVHGTALVVAADTEALAGGGAVAATLTTNVAAITAVLDGSIGSGGVKLTVAHKGHTELFVAPTRVFRPLGTRPIRASDLCSGWQYAVSGGSGGELSVWNTKTVRLRLGFAWQAQCTPRRSRCEFGAHACLGGSVVVHDSSWTALVRDGLPWCGMDSPGAGGFAALKEACDVLKRVYIYTVSSATIVMCGVRCAVGS